ncbi:MAG: HD domain-containing protein [Candidatus Omnitrophota bacterium]
MIDEIVNWFRHYTDRFHTDDPLNNWSISLKTDHSLRVSRIAASIAAKENFDEDDIKTATIAGLLHDLGRFEQYRRFQTFSDHRSINHGQLGAEIARESGCLSRLGSEEQEQVIKAVHHHNSPSVPVNEDIKTIAFIKLVRDADKIDIFHLSCEYFKTRSAENKNPAVELELSDEQTVSEGIYAAIMAGTIALMKDLKTLDDFKALQMSWVFDINYMESLRLILQQDTLKKIYETFSIKTGRINDIFTKTSSYLGQKIQNELVRL